jgi:radical SAM superfamily enzyme YgiQ (UPF0313 family)
VGIESPNESSLRETKKFQNVRPVGTLAERVRRIQDSGMEVMGGMILGFDHDDENVFDAQLEFIADARIINVMLGMLSAIPKTPLYDRIVAEGRLDLEGESSYGTNLIPLLLGREQLREGFVRVLKELNEPDAYFARLESLYLEGRMDFSRAANRYWRRHPLHWIRAKTALFAQAMYFLVRLLWKVDDPALRREYRKRIWRLVRARPDASILWIAVVKSAMQYHAQQMARRMIEGRTPVINTYQAS